MTTMLQPVPRVSVVVPAYNAAATLAETIESLLAQDWPDLEIVIIDDGSNDATPDVLRSYSTRIRSIRQTNAGLAAARNAGLALATGVFIALCDADDIARPGRISAQVGVLLAEPEVGLVASDFSAFDSSGPLAPSYLARYYDAVRRAGGLEKVFQSLPRDTHGVRYYAGSVYETLIWGNFLHPPTVMFRRELMDRVGRFNTKLRNMCDFDWLLRAARLAPVALIDAPLLDYRLSQGQMSSDRNLLAMKLDAIDIVERLRSDDPELYSKHRARFRRRVAQSYLGAAAAVAAQDRACAWRYFARSVVGSPPADSAKVLAKLLMPRSMIDTLRHWRGRLQRPAT